MRLRLRIERNALPPVSLLWPLTPTQSTSLTIAHLLSSIDGTIPLETQNWGLEDYIVTLAGYECLQHHTVGSVFAQDDEVVIRPRTWAETRARTVLGRSAVTGDGRRIEDGVPWGRVGLRGTVRPEVEIPAKRKRDEEDEQDNKRVRFAGCGDEDEEEAGGGEGQRMIEGVPAGRRRTVLPFDVEDEDEDDENDEDFEMGEDEHEVTFGASSSSDSDSESESESPSDSSSSGSDVSSDSDSSSGSSDSSDSSSDSSSDGDETPNSSETLWNGISSSPAKARRPPRTNSASAKTQQATSGAGQRPQTNGVRKQVPPGSGSNTTKGRNVRRRDAKKLKYLQSVGTLPPSATLTTLYEWRDSGRLPKTDTPTGRKETQERSEEESAAVNGRASEEAAEQVSSLSKAMQAKRKQLLADLESGGVEVTQKKQAAEPETEEVDERPEEMSSRADAIDTSADGLTIGVTAGEISHVDGTAATEQSAESSSRRARLDANSAQRLLFGSLGVRVPKTAEQKIALQKKLAGEARKAVPRPAPPAEAPPAEDAPEEDPEAWRTKITIRAVECWDENVELSTPPYPFYQRWDAQYRKRKNRNQNAYTAGGGGRKRKRGQQVQQAFYGGKGEGETYDKYHITGEGDFLDYGDDLDYGAWDEDAEYWEEGALLGDEDEGEGEEWDEDPSARQLQSEAAAEDAVVDDFPPLPGDLGTLPAVTKDGVKQGDYVVYEELACSPATGWQPKMLVRTVQLLGKVDADGEAGAEWRVKIAPRDLPPKRFDEEGNRVYEKFEMAGASDDEEEDEEGVEVLGLGDIAVLRLLARGEVMGDGATVAS